MLAKKIVILLLSSLIVACAAIIPSPPKSRPVPKQVDLTQPLSTTGTTPASTTLPIVELPQASVSPLKEINKIGQIPQVTELTDTTLGNIDLTGNDTIQLDFEQVSLRQLIEIVGDTLKLNLVIDPSIGDKITLRTSKDRPLKKQDLWPLLQLLLNEAGISVEKKGDVYYFKKTGPTLPGNIGSSTSPLSGSDAPEVLQITPLRYVSIDSVVAVIAPMVQPRGRIVSLPNLNIIGIITTPQRLERINKLINILDSDPFLHRGMRLFRLTNSKATELQAELDKILQALSGKTPPAYQAVALERINAILVVAPPGGGFDEVANWIEVLDGKSDESKEQVFIYHVRNLEAGKLATTLAEVFKQEGDKQDEKQKKDEFPPQEPVPPVPERPEDREEEQQAQKTPQKPTRPVSGVLAVSAELKVNLVADESTNSLLIKATPRDYRQLLETIYALDKVPKEVMINAVIAEVTLNESTRFGIDWQLLFGDVRNNGRNYVGTNFGVRGTEGQSSLILSYAAGSLNAVLNLLASTNDVVILSRPSLLVRNNEEASMNVGSNQPVLGSINRTTSNDNLVSQDVQYRDTGITVKVTPRINDDGIINMKIEQEFSQVGKPALADIKSPSFDQRKVSTSVVVQDGSAIVIGGLIETRNTHGREGIPVLKDLPVVGDILFSSTEKTDARTELVLIIVPQIVSPELNNRPMMQEFGRRMQMITELISEEFLVIEGFTPSKELKPGTKK